MSLKQIIATSLIEEIQESAKTKSIELNNPEFEPECYMTSIEVSLSHMDVNCKQNLIQRLSNDDFVDSDIQSSVSSTSSILSFIEDAEGQLLDWLISNKDLSVSHLFDKPFYYAACNTVVGKDYYFITTCFDELWLVLVIQRVLMRLLK